MFTGIVEEIGKIQAIQSDRGLGKRMVIQAKKVLEDVNLGDSIAVNGICLTVTNFTKHSFAVDVMPETIDHTSLKDLQAGSSVNLERAMQAGGRFGGHIVSGHIDGIATIINRETLANAIIYSFRGTEEMLKYMVARGSVTIDGISLTLIDVTDTTFAVSLIPHTKDMTILGSKKKGDIVNIECDMLAKYVEKILHGGNRLNQSNQTQLQSQGTSGTKKTIDMDFLASAGML